MPTKKTAAKKRASKKTAKKTSRTATAARAKKKPASKQATAKKKAVSRKQATTKKSAKKTTRKASKKTTKTAAKKKVAKKAAKKTSSKKTARAGKSTAKRKDARKKVTKKKSASTAKAKKQTKRKAAAAPARSAKKAAASSRARPAKKSATGKKTVARRPAAPRANVLTGPVPGFSPYQPKRNEDYMSDDQLEHFRQILQAWKRELMEEVDRTMHHMKDDASNPPDPNDRATQETEFGLELRTRDRERKLLKKIESALDRIDDGSYGYCEETGDEIGLRRLEARPVATLCVEAQERRELAEKQFRDREDYYR